MSLPSSSPCVVASCRRVMSSLCRSCRDSSFCWLCRHCHAAVASPRRLVIAVYCVASRRLPLHVSLLVILSSSAVSSLPSIASPLTCLFVGRAVVVSWLLSSRVIVASPHPSRHRHLSCLHRCRIVIAHRPTIFGWLLCLSLSPPLQLHPGPRA